MTLGSAGSNGVIRFSPMISTFGSPKLRALASMSSLFLLGSKPMSSVTTRSTSTELEPDTMRFISTGMFGPGVFPPPPMMPSTTVRSGLNRYRRSASFLLIFQLWLRYRMFGENVPMPFLKPSVTPVYTLVLVFGTETYSRSPSMTSLKLRGT